MNFKFEGTYKSISNIEWNDIPPFAIITGENGVGKTQLLELIHYVYSYNSNLRGLVGTPKVERLDIHKDEVIFNKSEWQVGNSSPVSTNAFSNVRKGHYNNFKNAHFRSQQHNQKFNEIFSRYEKIFDKNRSDVTREEFFDQFPLIVNYDPRHSVNEIAGLFCDYRINQMEYTMQGKTEEFINEFGEKPWTMLNNILKRTNLEYTFSTPEKQSMAEGFQLNIIHNKTKEIVQLQDLSSGEKIIISLILFLFTSQKYKTFPKLLLLDEPDAHLHPSMTKELLYSLNDVLVKEFGARVIMTTHSPSTVALSPENSLFEMTREEPRIRKLSSKNRGINILTSGIITINKTTKYVLVEDRDDVKFYNFHYDFLLRKKLIDSDVSLTFIPASNNNTSGGGGKTVVNSWVSKLRNSGLQHIMQGIIDRDENNEGSEGIYLLNRYSIENYILDPLVVYAALLEQDNFEKISEIDIKEGEEHLIALLDKDESLQLISDYILSKAEEQLKQDGVELNEADKERKTITYHNKRQIQAPRWLIDQRGKTLLSSFKKRFGRKINNNDLLRAYKRVGLISVDICEIITNLQNSQ